MTLHLVRLPYLALEIVLKYIDVRELFRLAALNTRLSCVIAQEKSIKELGTLTEDQKKTWASNELLSLLHLKLISNQRKFLELNKVRSKICFLQEVVTISITMKSKNDEVFIISKHRIGEDWRVWLSREMKINPKCKWKIEEEPCQRYWDELIKLCKSEASYWLEKLRIDFHTVSIVVRESFNHNEYWKSVMLWLLSIQPKFHKLEIHESWKVRPSGKISKSKNTEHLKFLLDISKAAECLEYTGHGDNRDIRTHGYTGVISSKSIRLICPKWLNMSTLRMCDSEDIDIRYVSVSHKEIIEFVRNWQKGTHPKLKKMRLSFHKLKVSVIITKLETVASTSKRTCLIRGKERFFMGTDIRNVHGDTATILHLDDYDTFAMVINPDASGNYWIE